MKIIRPITITDAKLTSSNVPECDDIGTSATSLSIGTGSTAFTTQASLRFAANDWLKAYSTATPANYFYGKVTSYTGTTLTINVTVTGGSGGPFTDWKISYGWDAGATYGANDQVEVSTPNIHKIYKSKAGGNINHDPTTDTTNTYWDIVSSTNRWKAFDAKVGSQVSQADSITYRITPGETVDSIAFLNLDAGAVTIVMTDPTDGVVLNTTINLVKTTITGTSSVYDWYSYFFASITTVSDFVRLDLPLYFSAYLDITITSTGGTAKVGEIIIGQQSTIGTTKYGPSIGITDYSQKAVDAYGVYSVTPGAFSKRMNCDFILLNDSLDDVANILADYRATPVVWIGDESYSALIVYGYYRDFTIQIPYPTFSIATIEIEGLT